MKRTKHFNKRQSQRALKAYLVRLVLIYGVSQASYGAEKTWMNRESLREVMADEPWLNHQDIAELKKCVVVSDGETLITAYKRG